MNIFENALKRKLRFESNRGDLTTEQLFDLKLADLDTIAQRVSKGIRDVSESFIDAEPSKEKISLELKLEVLKSIIKTKQEELAYKMNRQKLAERRRKILDALDAKDDKSLEKKSKKELLDELQSLG